MGVSYSEEEGEEEEGTFSSLMASHSFDKKGSRVPTQ